MPESSKIVLTLPIELKAHSEPFLQALQEECIRMYLEYGYCKTVKEAEKWRDSIEVRFSVDS